MELAFNVLLILVAYCVMKPEIDSLVVRSGDVLAAGTVYLGTKVFALGLSRFAAIELVLALLVASVMTRLEFCRRTALLAKAVA